MGFVTGNIRREFVPHEEGEFIEFRMLSLNDLEEAETERTRKLMASVKAMGGEIFQALQGIQGTRETDPWDSYDKSTLLRYAIRYWSYDIPAVPEYIVELDAKTARWALGIIREMNEPKTDDAQKNGF